MLAVEEERPDRVGCQDFGSPGGVSHNLSLEFESESGSVGMYSLDGVKIQIPGTSLVVQG